MTTLNFRDRVSPGDWDLFRRCRFVPKTFRPYPCVTAKDSLDEEGARGWAPYRGQPFDPEISELIEDAWDHEHCDVCGTRIDTGNDYWKNDGPEHVDLCIACYPLVQRELDA